MEEDLMSRVRAGDRAAFEEIYRRHAERVYAYLWRMVEEHALVADLRQETFFRLWLARERWRDGGSVAGYLIRTARNLALNAQRQQRLHRRLDAAQRDGPTPSAPSAETVLAKRELTRRVDAAIASLPERAREVFSLKRDAGLSYREISELLGISSKTVEVHMTRALKLLRVALADVRNG
ncbi:MAG TPA: RNA polymerase sigma-70 factor [Longimicrobiaceae bacterium]|nr:RNA polymerase sigma-70 factor [Longimicrobiaceae bacterium]